MPRPEKDSGGEKTAAKLQFVQEENDVTYMYIFLITNQGLLLRAFIQPYSQIDFISSDFIADFYCIFCTVHAYNVTNFAIGFRIATRPHHTCMQRYHKGLFLLPNGLPLTASLPLRRPILLHHHAEIASSVKGAEGTDGGENSAAAAAAYAT